MEKGQNVKTVLLVIVAQLCAIITLVGAFFAGFFLKGYFSETALLVGIITTFSVWVILIVANIILKSKAVKKLNQMRVKEANEFMLNRKEDIKINFDKATKKLHRVSLFCKIYVIFVILFLHISSFFMGAYFSAFTPFLILAFFFVAGIYIHVAMAISNKPKLEIPEYLSRKDFPYLYSIADEAMEQVGIKGKFYICTDRSFNGSISKFGNTYLINLGCSLVNCLDRDELYNILLHEYAHVSEKYTPKGIQGFFHRFMEFDGDNLFSFFADSIIAYPTVKYATEYVFYTFLASEYIEKMADSVINENGNPTSFVSALAKCNLHFSYERVDFLYNIKPLFESEKPRDTLASEYLDGFHLSLKDNMEKWLDGYEKEIQPRNSTHPIYRLRCDSVGVKPKDVKISFEITDEKLKNEAKKLLDFTNEMIVKNLTPHYETSRKDYYLIPLDIVNEWEKDKSAYNSTDLNNVIDSLASLNRHKEAEVLCDEIIATESNIYATAYAKFFKGFMLANDDDYRCLDLLYEVIELNANFMQGCLDLIGHFACRNGLQEELDTYREKAISLSQKYVDEDEKASTLSRKDNIVKDTIDKETLDKHVSYILSTSDKIKSIYLVRKIISDSFYSRVFVVEFEKNVSLDDVQKSWDKIFSYFDCLDGEQYSLFYGTKYYIDIVKRIDGSLVYSK